MTDRPASTCTCAAHRKVTIWVDCKRFDELTNAGVIDSNGYLIRPEAVNFEVKLDSTRPSEG